MVNYPLKSCVWEITLGCCFNCKYCGSKAGKARENELSTDECLDVARQLVQLGCKKVSMIGGEVFMRKDWPIIVKALTDENVRVNIITNGFLFDESLISILKDVHINSIAVSLDGPEDIHDKYRTKGSFKRGLEAIDILSRNHIPVSVISTLHKENVHRLEEMYEILEKTNIFAWQLQACSPMGNASEVDVDIDFNDVISFVEKYMYSAPFSVGVADNIGYYGESEGSIRGNTSGLACFTGCRAGLTAIGIDSVGNVKGCEAMYDESFIEGNLREKTLESIWNDPDAFSYNRKFTLDMLEGACKTCKHGNKCAAGCRSYNYFTHGKFYENIRCVNIKKDNKL